MLQHLIDENNYLKDELKKYEIDEDDIEIVKALIEGNPLKRTKPSDMFLYEVSN